LTTNGSTLPYPTGKTAEHLYNHSRALVDRLQQILNGTGSVSQLQVTLEEIQADIADGAVTPEQAFQLSLVTAAATVVGSVESRLQELREANEAAAKALITEIVRGREDGGTIRVEQAVRETETSSLATQITQLTADLGATTALVTTEQTARATGDDALAAQIDTVSTALDGNVTQVQTIQESVDGLSGLWGVTVSTNGFVTGMVSLIGGVTGSKFRVEVDQFEVAAVGSVIGWCRSAIDTTTTPPTIVLNGNIIAPGSITANQIAANTITANELAAGAITAVSLDAVSGILGSVTTGRIQSPDGRLDINALGDSPYIRLTL
jgi:hypothetical protein